MHILLMWRDIKWMGRGIHINTKAMLQIGIDVEFVWSYIVWTDWPSRFWSWWERKGHEATFGKGRFLCILLRGGTTSILRCYFGCQLISWWGCLSWFPDLPRLLKGVSNLITVLIDFQSFHIFLHSCLLRPLFANLHLTRVIVGIFWFMCCCIPCLVFLLNPWLHHSYKGFWWMSIFPFIYYLLVRNFMHLIAPEWVLLFPQRLPKSFRMCLLFDNMTVPWISN